MSLVRVDGLFLVNVFLIFIINTILITHQRAKSYPVIINMIDFDWLSIRQIEEQERAYRLSAIIESDGDEGDDEIEILTDKYAADISR